MFFSGIVPSQMRQEVVSALTHLIIRTSASFSRFRGVILSHFFDRVQRNLIGREPWSSGFGGDSCSEGLRFESQHRRLDGHNFTLIIC